jgi:hypothetical protein
MTVIFVLLLSGAVVIAQDILDSFDFNSFAGNASTLTSRWRFFMTSSISTQYDPTTAITAGELQRGLIPFANRLTPPTSGGLGGKLVLSCFCFCPLLVVKFGTCRCVPSCRNYRCWQPSFVRATNRHCRLSLARVSHSDHKQSCRCQSGFV